MYEYIYRILEICSIICIIHYAYGETIKVNKEMIMLIIFDLSILNFIDVFKMNTAWSFLIYICIATYIFIKFPYGFRKNIACNLFYILLLSLLQLFWGMIVLNRRKLILPNKISICIINFWVLISVFLLKKYIHKFFSSLLNDNKKVIMIYLIFSLFLILNLIKYKLTMFLTTEQLVIILVFGSMIFVSLYFWQRENIKRKQKEMDLKVHEIYEESFKDLIDSIRKRQHEYHNHMQAILCMHYTTYTYKELVKKQESYFKIIKNNNKFYSLLTNSWPILIGFLYGKFQEADDKNIEVVYDVKLVGRKVGIPEYILIEILGIILDNAIEAAECMEESFIQVEMKEAEYLEIIVANPIQKYCENEIQNFFVKGYSSKSGHEGLGLNKISEYQKQYKFNKEVVIKEIRDTTCISIQLQIKWL